MVHHDCHLWCRPKRAFVQGWPLWFASVLGRIGISICIAQYIFIEIYTFIHNIQDLSEICIFQDLHNLAAYRYVFLYLCLLLVYIYMFQQEKRPIHDGNGVLQLKHPASGCPVLCSDSWQRLLSTHMNLRWTTWIPVDHLWQEDCYQLAPLDHEGLENKTARKIIQQKWGTLDWWQIFLTSKSMRNLKPKLITPNPLSCKQLPIRSSTLFPSGAAHLHLRTDTWAALPHWKHHRWTAASAPSKPFSPHPSATGRRSRVAMRIELKPTESGESYFTRELTKVFQWFPGISLLETTNSRISAEQS